MRRRITNYKPRSFRKIENRSKKRLIWTIIFTIITIFALLNWGLPLIIDGFSIFNRLKSPTKHQDLSQNVTLSPPVLNIPIDSTSSAELTLNGYTSPNLVVKIFIDDNLVTTTSSNEEGRFETQTFELNLGTNNIYGKTVDEKGNESLASKTIPIYFSSEKPKLEISEPEDGKEIKGGDKKVRVSGITDPDNEVTVNGLRVIINNAGNFSTEINLNDGENFIIVSARNQVGNSQELQKRVVYNP